MTIEEMMDEFGIIPLLKNIADVAKKRAKKGPHQAGFDAVASEKLGKLIKELENDEQLVASVVNSMYRIHDKKEVK